MKPTQILAKLCKDAKMDSPSYANGTVRIGRKLFRIQSLDESNDWYHVKGKYFQFIKIRSHKINFLIFVIN